MATLDVRELLREGVFVLANANPGVPVAPSRLLWTTPEANLWVANRYGEYAGMVEFADGHFIARDNTGHILGTEVSVAAAKLLVRNNSDSDAGILGTVQTTIQRVAETLTAPLTKPNPHYHRSV